MNLRQLLSTTDVISLLTPAPLLVERRGRRVGIFECISDVLPRAHINQVHGFNARTFSGRYLPRGEDMRLRIFVISVVEEAGWSMAYSYRIYKSFEFLEFSGIQKNCVPHPHHRPCTLSN
jgi:hypothetical protein